MTGNLWANLRHAFICVMHSICFYLFFLPPFYSYPPSVECAGGTCKYISLRPRGSGGAADWHVDVSELERAITPRTKMLIINNPSNLPGKVFSRSELTGNAKHILCRYATHARSPKSCVCATERACEVLFTGVMCRDRGRGAEAQSACACGRGLRGHGVRAQCAHTHRHAAGHVRSHGHSRQRWKGIGFGFISWLFPLFPCSFV